MVITPLETIDSIPKSLYTKEAKFDNDLERDIVDAIVVMDNVKWWTRNVPRRGFRINGFINHYPDLMIMTKSNKLVLIETKGDDRDNSNSKLKIALGEIWKRKAGEDYCYFMVFDKKELDENGAYSKSKFLEMFKYL